ncbi:hypothetical protein [Belliella pelovolcani]|uniref:Outer membrane protein beta-barrel domain-containing protein n=1 Tax=Belliella pelovolcani TaxID=529505 RepID=A0A1N7Q2B5_9BACT|nr:hypothetical protein [Belliella pelovolcani]SIT16747.1 hypothetical protein SAMN05421761_1252 [Belliella pelovolcani]
MKNYLQIITILAFTIFLFSLNPCLGQGQQKPDKSPKWDLGLEGMAGVAFGREFYSFNVGGPSLLFRFNSDFKVGFGALPSFYIKEGKTGAKLGVAPRVDYKNIALFVPFYHFDNDDTWVWSIGIGYKFHRKQN